MPAFGAVSVAQLQTCRPALQRLALAVVKGWDCTVDKGHRPQAEQHAAFLSGASQKDWPDGPHNALPSNAFDLYPYPRPDDKTAKGRATYYAFAGYVLGVASQLGIPIRWGGDWDSDHDLMDQTFDDLVHFELKEG
jgi:peptidoglycan L-alanyl-D-glutamate endopeptidase CwlK